MKAILKRWGTALFCSLLGACGSIVDMGGNSSVNPRRMFVNDVAVNDSLRSAMLGRGVSFVMQPGKEYDLRVQTPDTNARLSLYVINDNNTVSSIENGIEGVATGGYLTFPLQSERSVFARHLVFLRSPDGTPAQRPTQVRLFPAGESPVQSSELSVKLILVGQMTNLPTNASKIQFAREFNEELISIYASYGITVDTASQIVDADAPPVIYDFYSNAPLPGTRVPNTVHMYLVDSISIEDGPPNSQILGFAPREALDLDSHPTSRVLLSARESAVAIATTAAHELGHFLGLRHTSSTEQDLQQDRDQSNRHDGFSSTSQCELLAKPAVIPHIEAIGPEGTMYCLRVANTCPPVSSCPAVENLMFPYACGSPVSQREMTEQQQTFARENLWLYQ